MSKIYIMTVIDLMIELSKLPPDLEVVYENTQKGDQGIRMVVVTTAGEIMTDTGDRFVLLNVGEEEEENDLN